ncbi:MAG: hypothetical protein AB8B65_10235 [Kordia sp.]|uniref:hypothetical protein n=1 Tax=Kordia sp. TaxID=1965332 RepID=UPI00385F528B
MKSYFVIFFLVFGLLLFSCKSTKVPTTDTYQIISSKFEQNYAMASYVKQKDTILVVKKGIAMKTCFPESVHKKVLLKLLQVTHLDEKISFYYKAKTVNGQDMFEGFFAPENKEVTQIYAYNNYPYLLTDCKQLQ